jgi:hypothetical protein
MLCSRLEFDDLTKRMKSVEKRSLEQDERLANDGIRLEKLEKKINDPMSYINELIIKMDKISLEMQNKVSVRDLYDELLKKADINSVKNLENSIIRLNELLNDLSN